MTPTRTDTPGVGADLLDTPIPDGAVPAPPDEPARWAEGCTPGELILAWAMVAVLAAFGAYVMMRPGPTLFDSWALARLPDRHHLGALVTVTRLGSPVVIMAGAGAAFLITFRRNLPRATALLVSPAAAVVVSDFILKPAVGRTFEGALSFPSGTTAAVSALAAVAVLAVPSRARGAMCVVGAALSLATAVAVVALGWHYPSDAVGGVATGVGVVLVADTSLCRARARLASTPTPDDLRARDGATQ